MLNKCNLISIVLVVENLFSFNLLCLLDKSKIAIVGSESALLFENLNSHNLIFIELSVFIQYKTACCCPR